MKWRVANSFLLMGTGLLILSMLLTTVSLAAPAQVPENRPPACHERGCNETLLPGDRCAPGLQPYNGVCRNPACPEETDCECPTPPAQCNEDCAEASCAEGLSCIGGVCRNPACPEETDCECPHPPAQCNEDCTEASCAEGLSCIGGVCRNPACPEETDCECPTPHCPDATITVHVSECNAALAGASVELHSSGGDRYGPKTTSAAGEAAFSVIGGSDRLWYAIVNGVKIRPTIKVTECGGTGTIDPVFPCAATPTPTPIVEVLGVERLPVAGEMAPLPALPSLPFILPCLVLISAGFLLRRAQ